MLTAYSVAKHSLFLSLYCQIILKIEGNPSLNNKTLVEDISRALISLYKEDSGYISLLVNYNKVMRIFMQQFPY